MIDSKNKVSIFSALIFSVLVSGCGGTLAQVAALDATPTPSAVATPNPTPDLGLNRLADHSVNQASSQYVAPVLRMTTTASSANAVGNFVGGGNGNKAVLGFPLHDRALVSTISTIGFEGTPITVNTATTPYFNLLVELDCNPTEDPAVDPLSVYRSRRRIIALDFTGAQMTSLGGGLVRYQASASDSVWLIVGSALGGLPSNSSGTHGKLSDFFAAYPSACLINGISGDGGYGRDRTLAACQTSAGLAATDPGACGVSQSGVTLILGGSSTLSQEQWDFQKFIVGSTIYQ